MDSQVSLFEELLEKSEKYLTIIGIWPNANNRNISLLTAAILLGFSVLVVLKNIFDPDRESIENAFALANGCLVMVTYSITVFIKREKFNEFLNFIKSSNQILTTRESKDLSIASGREYQLILKGFSYILPASIFVRFLQPPLEYAVIQLFFEDKTFNLPPSMGIPESIFGEIPTYILESSVRMIMLSTLMGINVIFITSTLRICTQFNILASDLENLTPDNEEAVDKLIERHQELLRHAKLWNEFFSPYFFVDCCLSFINLSILMFSMLDSNIRIQNYLMEIPLFSAGVMQLFFVLYFGDRLLDATSQIADAAYMTKWNDFTVKMQKKFVVLISRGQKPQTLNFGEDVMIASMLLFSQIWQRAWSAFNILRTMVK